MADELDPLRMGGPVNRGPGVTFDPTKATTTNISGAVGGAGETVIPWIITGSFDGLPENVRGALVGYNSDGTARKLEDTSSSDLAAQRTTGYAIDPKSGEIILRQEEGGSARGGVAIDPNLSAEQAKNLGITSGMNVSYPASASLSSSSSTTKQIYTAPDGKIFTDLNAYNAYIAKTAADEKLRKGQSAYDLLFAEFDRYGMGGLLNDVKQFIQEGLSKDELTLKLRGTQAYQKRFAANAQRIKKGFRAISEAEYIGLEDQYQNVMRQYGLPESYYTRGDMGVSRI